MRVAVAGKGGAGKTTTAATLARVLARRGYQVTALDDDPNLAVALGLAPEQLKALTRVPGDVVEERFDAQGFGDLHLTLPFDQVLERYGVRGPDNVGVLMMTGLLGAGQG